MNKPRQKSMDMFHKSNIYTIYQFMCVRKHGPLRLSQGTQYQCLRYINDKEQPQEFSKENTEHDSIFSFFST